MSFIAIEGPIGVGKTTLTNYLADTFKCEKLLELPEENPFLKRFYANEENSALPTQLFFLFQRAKQVNALQQSDLFQQTTISDFLIEKDQLFAQLTLDDDELRLYQQVYDQLTINAPAPDLVIYLQAPTDVLLERIKERGIPAEQHIDSDYLSQLNEAYTRFFHYYETSPLLIVNTTDIDWVNNPSDYQNLVEYILSIQSGRHFFHPKSLPSQSEALLESK